MQRVLKLTDTGYVSRRRPVRFRKGAGPQPASPSISPLPLIYRLRMRNAGSGTWATLVKQMRAATGMTGAELARRLDVDRATIWRWEAGRQKPESPDLIKAFADLFGLDLDDALKAAGLRPSTEERQAAAREPTDPDVLKLLKLLADPATAETTKTQIRAMLRVLAELADQQQPPRKASRRRGA